MAQEHNNMVNCANKDNDKNNFFYWRYRTKLVDLPLQERKCSFEEFESDMKSGK